MKKLNVFYFLTMMLGASMLFACHDDDPVPPTTNQEETPDTNDDEQSTGDDDGQGTDNNDDSNDEDGDDQTPDEDRGNEDPDDGDDNGDDTPDVPVTEFKVKVNGEDFTYKVLKGRYFPDDDAVSVEVREIDDTNTNQRILGFEIYRGRLSAPGDYDIETLNEFDVVMYMFDAEGKSYQTPKGIITIKNISETRIEMTFDSITLFSGYEGVDPVILTDGSVYVDLVRQ